MISLRHVTIVLLVSLTVLPLTAQTPAAEEARFEVVSVRPTPAGSPQTGYVTPARYIATISVVELTRYAYQLPFYGLVDGPDWARSERFAINAAMPATRVEGDVPFMVRHLLADRFGLTVHREARLMPVFALLKARADGELGPQLQPGVRDCSQPGQGIARPCGMSLGLGGFRARGVPWEAIVRRLEETTGRPIIDETGLSGRWDAELEFLPEQVPDGVTVPRFVQARPGVFTAVREQLGLKVAAREAPVDVLVIDSAERPSPN